MGNCNSTKEHDIKINLIIFSNNINLLGVKWAMFYYLKNKIDNDYCEKLLEQLKVIEQDFLLYISDIDIDDENKEIIENIKLICFGLKNLFENLYINL